MRKIMSIMSFEQFVNQQKENDVDKIVVWQTRINELYTRVDKWLKPYIDRDEIQITNKNILYPIQENFYYYFLNFSEYFLIKYDHNVKNNNDHHKSIFY